eukprot:311659_1
MATNVKDLLCEHICNAQTINGILPLLRLIPFQAIQESVLEVIRDLDTNTANDIGYKCLSMTDILPDDLIQYIVSFTDSLQMKYVSKPFNACYHKNKAVELKQRQRAIDKQELTYKPNYQQHNTTWVIHPTRTHLTSEEIANGYEGPMNELKELVENVKKGDKLLFYDGNYVETERAELNVLKKSDVQVIGMGSNVKIKIYETSDDMRSHNLYLKNIKLEMRDDFVVQSSTMTMEDCEIMMMNGSRILIFSGIFNARNCVFRVSDDFDDPLSTILTFGGKVNIIGCTFSQFKRTCVTLSAFAVVAVRCIGNMFKDNLEYPIAKDRDASVKYPVVTHNTLEGYHGVNGHCSLVDSANKIYIIKDMIYQDMMMQM